MSKRLAQWEKDLPASLIKRQTALKSRRDFLAGLVMSSVAAAVPAPLRAGEAVAQENDVAWCAEEPWLTFAIVQEHLFPHEEDAPGAGDIQAVRYLKQALEAPDVDGEERDFILKGVQWLDGIAGEMYERPFKKLNEDQREAVLRKIAASKAGENWLSLLLTYLFEALLSDPVYGGNPQGIGWRWLEHQPGFPQPPADKRYFKL